MHKKYALTVAFFITFSYTNGATLKSNIYRTLPFIIDESVYGRKFEVGFGYRTGENMGEQRTELQLTVVNQIFSAYNHSVLPKYFRYSPRSILSLRMGYDETGYSADVAVRNPPSNISGFLAPGVTFVSGAATVGYRGERPLFSRCVAGVSIAPYAVFINPVSQFGRSFRLNTNVAWIQYPVWIESNNTYYDTASVITSDLFIKHLGKGEALVAGAGLAYQGKHIVLEIATQRIIMANETAISVNTSCQGMLITFAKPTPQAQLVARAGVRF